MAEYWGAIGAVAALVLPMVLAGWLLGRPGRRRRETETRGKMPENNGG